MIPRIMLEYPRIRGPAQALRGVRIHFNRAKSGWRGEPGKENYQELVLISIDNQESFAYRYINGAGERRSPSPTPPQPAHKEFTMEDKVLNAMKEAGKPVRPGDIAKALGVDSKEVSKACAELKKAGKIHSPKRCYYEPVAE
jgi:predicted Rossmann fold nucleotide-binding protein DprA/Smf involved in DNA uptake